MACREQLDASYDRLKVLRQQEATLLAELQQQQAAGSSSEAELAGLQAVVGDLVKKKVWPGSVLSLDTSLHTGLHITAC